MKQEETFIPALGAGWATRFYDPLVRLTTREFAFKRALIEQADLSEAHKILDLACGTGTLSIGIKKRFPKIDIVGVDADKKVLDIARQKVRQKKMEIDFLKEFSDSTSFHDKSFDRVFSTLFFHHLTREKKLKTFSEILRVLKADGEFHLADYEKPANIVQKALSNVIRIVDGDETTRDNFAGDIQQLMEESGFSTITLTRIFKTVLGTIRLFKATKS